MNELSHGHKAAYATVLYVAIVIAVLFASNYYADRLPPAHASYEWLPLTFAPPRNIQRIYHGSAATVSARPRFPPRSTHRCHRAADARA